MISRRKFLAGLMAGGTVIAGELWVPGQKLISIPSGKVYAGPLFRLDGQTIRYIGPENGTTTVNEFYEWLKVYAKKAMKLDKTNRDTPELVSLSTGYRFSSPEHLVEGTLCQDAPASQVVELREMWTCDTGLDGQDLFTDKIYYSQVDGPPRERITELDNGHRGYR